MEYGVSRRGVFSAIGYVAAVLFWLVFLLLFLGFLTTSREGGTQNIFFAIHEVYNHSPKTPWLVMGWWFAVGFIILNNPHFPSWKIVFKWLTIGMIGFLLPLVIYLVWM